MRLQKQSRVVTAVLVSLVLLISSVSVFHGAEEESGSITLQYELSDVSFRLYSVGELTSGGIVPTETFSSYHVDLNGENAAQTLALYIERDNIAPLMETKTDTRHRAVFDGLQKGVYLAMGDSTETDEATYTVMPAIISLPYPDGEEAVWSVRAEVKYEKTAVPVTQVSCLKVWKTTDAMFTTYPDVTAQLLRDGEVFDSVTLNDLNSWKHTWTDLDPQYRWTVTEKELDAEYTVDISCNQHVFTITNALDIPAEPVEPTVPTTKPPVTVAATARVPQTGQLNWPIPVLCVTGIALVLIGVLIVRKNRHEK